MLDETEDSATPGKPCVQKDRKEGSGSCFSGIRTWIQDSSQNAVILRGAEGGVAESILPERPLSLGERGDRFRRLRKNLKMRLRKKLKMTLKKKPREKMKSRMRLNKILPNLTTNRKMVPLNGNDF